MALKPARLQWADDGSLRSLDYDDVYFQSGKGFAESHYVFLEQNNLPERFKAPPENNFRIAELGFGSGLNFLLTAQLWARTAPPAARLTYVSIEKHPIMSIDLQKIYTFWPELAAQTTPLLEQYPPLVEGFHHLHFIKDRIQLILLFGDVAEVLPELSGTFDAWYLDGFSPAKNPDMWAESLLPKISARTRPQGTLTTFSAVGDVRRGLKAAGFNVKKIDGYGTKWNMTVAHMPEAPYKALHPVKNIAVLGAGLAGASAAYALAKKGCKVTVFDRAAEAAAETSGNPVGIVYPKLTLAPSPFGSFHQHGFCFTRSLATALRLPSWNPCGVFHLDISDEEVERHSTFGKQDYPADYLRYEESAMGKGLYQPTAGYLSPPEFCRVMLDHPNITLRYSTEVTTLEELDYDAIVIALNHHTGDFKETQWLPLQTLRGQISYLKATTASKQLKQVFCHDGFITPVHDNIHVTGATFQREGPSTPTLRDDDHQENIEKLNQYMPSLGFTAENITGGRAGYRTTTPDKLPVIGGCPDYDRFVAAFKRKRDDAQAVMETPKIYLSAAFGAFGTTGAPLAGEMIASSICGDPLPVPVSLISFLAPDRFLIRDLKRGKI